MQLEHSVSALSEKRREAQAPCYGSTAGPPHPVPQLQISGIKVTLETVRSLGNNMRNLTFWHQGPPASWRHSKDAPSKSQTCPDPIQLLTQAAHSHLLQGWLWHRGGQNKEHPEETAGNLSARVFHGGRERGVFLMLQQLGMLPWSPTAAVPCKLACIQRQRLLSFGILPLLSLIWWKQECWAQSWGRCLVLSPMNSVSPHPQQHRESLEQGWPHPSPRSGWVWSRGHAAEPLGHMIEQASYS